MSVAERLRRIEENGLTEDDARYLLRVLRVVVARYEIISAFGEHLLERHYSKNGVAAAPDTCEACRTFRKEAAHALKRERYVLDTGEVPE